MSAFRLQFDTAHISRLHNLPLYVFLVGIVLIGGAVIFNAKRFAPVLGGAPDVRWRRSFGAFMMLAGATALVGGTINGERLRRLRDTGAFEVVEGCLTLFHPQGARRGDQERIVVGGVGFSYGAYEAIPSFHATAAKGGPIQPDTRVRLGYAGGDILRVETIEHACPRAPDSGPIPVVRR